MKRKQKRRIKRMLSRSIASALGVVLATTMIPPMEANTYLKAEKVSNDSALIIGENNENKIKNVIYMIPDGAGFPSYDIAKAVKKAGQNKMRYNVATKWTSNEMYLDKYLVGSCTTKAANGDSTNSSATDSAAAGTALACGKKTNNSKVGVTPNGKPMANLMEMSQLQGKATGMIVTSYTADATPASFGAHITNRKGREAILKQIASNGFNVVLGGCTKKQCDMSAKEIGKKYGYDYVTKDSELIAKSNVSYKNASEKLKLWGDFGKDKESYVGYDIDCNSGVPTLKEMTESAIKLLKQDDDGFFLMVEGSMIDKAAHAGDLRKITTDWTAFDEAFKVALDYASNRDDTMIVVAPDHNTGIAATPNEEKMQEAVDYVQDKKNTTDVEKIVQFAAKKTGKTSYPHTNDNVGVWMYLPDGTKKLN